jgi:D-xylose transport system ATP-binding protein
MPGLEFHDVRKSFGAVRALTGVTFTVREGESHALVGENGAGKSTLLKILAGIIRPDAGELTWNDERLSFGSPREALERGIGMVYQEMLSFPNLSVTGNIFAGRELTGAGGRLREADMRARTAAILDELHLRISPDAPADSLPAAHRQLLQVARALAFDCRILVLDEPTTSLTDAEADHLFAVIAKLKSRGATLLYVSHRLPEVFRLCDRITVLRDGASIATLETKHANKTQIIRHMVGREISDLFPRRRSRPGAAALEVQDLTVADRDSGERVLTGISFSLRVGEVLGIGGLMGAGRTQLLMHLFGAWGTRLTGSLHLNGRELRAQEPQEIIRRGMVLVSEDRRRYGLILDKTIGFNLSLSSLAKLTRNRLIDDGLEFQKNNHFFESLRMKAPTLEALVAKLSGGTQQKVVLGKALMTEPLVIFLDEPTRGIDVGAKLEIYEIINQLTDAGKAVLLVSSELPELIGMSDRILVLHQGRIGGEFDRDEATQEKLLAAAMGETHVALT